MIAAEEEASAKSIASRQWNMEGRQWTILGPDETF
jgi:hypothetical protein